MKTNTEEIIYPKIVTRNEWLAARKAFLTKEKEFTHQRDSLSAERRKLPMVKIEKEYVFDGPEGPTNLQDLFEGRRQLIIYHFMFDPEWNEGCKSCSYVADNFQGAILHLPARDTSFAVISRAPLSKLEPFKRRMGWNFHWLSSFNNDFNYDFHVTLDEAKGSVEYNYENTSSAQAKRARFRIQKARCRVLAFSFAMTQTYFTHTQLTYVVSIS